MSSLSTPPDELERALRRLDPVSPEGDFHGAKELRVPGTGKWLLDDDRYHKFIESPNSLLWISGSPGCGKTVLSAAVVESLSGLVEDIQSSTHVGLAYFFFNYKDSKKQTASGCLSSILAQLLRALPEQIISPKIYMGTEHLAVETVFDGLVETLSHFDRTYIVIDALDECAVDERQIFFRFLRTLRTYTDKFDCRILLTSRLNVDIVEIMDNLQHIKINIEASKTHEDLHKFAQHEIANNPTLSKLSSAKRNELATILTERSSGMILWANAQLKAFSDLYNDSKDIPSAISLGKVSKSLTELYEKALAAISPRDRPLAIESFRWLACSQEPLSLRALAEAVSLDPSQPSASRDQPSTTSILRVLHPLVGVYKNEKSTTESRSPVVDNVLFVHISFIDFLRTERDSNDSLSEFSVVGSEIHGSIAEKCLAYILRYVHSKRKTLEIRDFEEFPLLEYSCRYWTVHAQRYAEKVEVAKKEVVELATELLREEDSRYLWLSIFDPEDPSKLSFTPPIRDTPVLHYAVRAGVLEVVKNFLEGGADVNSVDHNGRQALHVAITYSSCKLSIIEELLRNQASATARDSNGQIPLLEAVKANNLELAILLHRYTAKEELCQELEDGSTIIHTLACKASGQIFSVFIGAERKIDAATNDLWVPPHLIFGAGNFVDVNLKDRLGYSLLHRAVKGGNDEVIKVLIGIGVDVNLGDAEGNTPLHIAALSDQQPVMDLLITSGADPFQENSDGKTPLQLAWLNKALEWPCYEVDDELTTERKVNSGTQADCQVLKKTGNCSGPEHIFRKTYNYGDRRLTADERREIYEVQLRECRNLQRIDHPFIVSYLGYEEILEVQVAGAKKTLRQTVLYLEFCGGGDLGTLHVMPKSSKSNAWRNDGNDDDDSYDDDEDSDASGDGENRLTTSVSKFSFGAEALPDVKPLNERDIWALIYQLFLALAYLHYGVKISHDGACQCEPHWTPLMHRDIKPHNVVLASGEDGSRVAKLCDLGLSRDIKRNQTKPVYRGTDDYQPREVKAGKAWTSKGDVWCLGKTIKALHKDFSPEGELKDILDMCTAEKPASRPSSLKVVEVAHKHVEKPFRSLEEELGLGPGDFLLQAFFKIAGNLDKYTHLETKTSFLPRKLLLKRLRMLLKDGAKKLRPENITSLHYAVLLEDIKLLKALLQNGQNPDEKWPKSRWTPLHLATQVGSLDMTRLLLESTKDKDPKDERGYTPLDYATRGGHYDIARAIQESMTATSFNSILERYNSLMQRTMLENLEMQRAQDQATGWWNPIELISKKDATS